MKSLLPCLFILLITNVTFSQTYQPFPGEGARWLVSGGGYQCNCCSQTQYTSTGDTVIDGLNYQKLNYLSIKYNENNQGCTSDIIGVWNGYVGAYRNDTIGKKVFIRFSQATSDSLLYDFDLQIGDTVESIFGPGYNAPDTVTGSDSMLIGNNYHKYWLTNSCVILIEGIGSSFGFFTNYDCPFETIYTLECFVRNDTSLYQYNPWHTCEELNGINEIEEISLSLFPNPASQNIQFDLLSTATFPLDLTVTNILGEVVIESRIINSFGNNLSVEKLPAGAYAIRLQNEDGAIYVGKFVKE